MNEFRRVKKQFCVRFFSRIETPHLPREGRLRHVATKNKTGSRKDKTCFKKRTQTKPFNVEKNNYCVTYIYGTISSVISTSQVALRMFPTLYFLFVNI